MLTVNSLTRCFCTLLAASLFLLISIYNILVISDLYVNAPVNSPVNTEYMLKNIKKAFRKVCPFKTYFLLLLLILSYNQQMGGL